MMLKQQYPTFLIGFKRALGFKMFCVRRLYEPLWAGVLYLGLAAPLQGLLNLGLHTSALRAYCDRLFLLMLVEQTYASLG